MNSIKYILEAINSRLVNAEEWITNLEDWVLESNEADWQKEGEQIKETVTLSRIKTFALQRSQKEKRERKRTKKKIPENFSTDIPVQKAQSP